MTAYTLYTETPITRLFFRAALPGAVSMLASALYQLFDGIFVGRFLGETPFAALNLAMPFVIINFAVADLVGVGSSVPISICLGKREDKEANNIFSAACILIVASGAALGAILFLSAPLLIRLMGAEGEFAGLAVQYLRVYALCSPVTTIVFAMDNYLRICGKVRGSMFLNIFMSVLICILEFLFLYVFRWGIWAAALATCLGMGLCAVIALCCFAFGNMQLRFCRPHFSGTMLRQIVTAGSPNFLNNIAGRLTSIIMNIFLVRFGGESAVSIYGVLMYAEGFILPLLYGMCDSLQPAVGCNWGANKFARVRAIEKRCFTATGVLSLCSAAVLFLFPAQIGALFLGTANAALLQETAYALRLFALAFITRWFSFAAQSFMLAIEKPGYACAISVSTAFFFPVLLIALLWKLELTGLWLNPAGTALLAGILAAILLAHFRKHSPQVFEKAEKVQG